MKVFFDYITKPWILSIIPSLVIILIMPFNNHRYNLILEDTERLNKNVFSWYEDINEDGNSERVVLFESDSIISIAVFSDTAVINQWNFRGRLGFMMKDQLYLAINLNNSDSKMIFFFSLSNDSLLMHAIGSPYNPVPIIRNRFVTIIGRGIRGYDPYLLWAEPEDLDGDGVIELIFGITTGFSLYPRAVFAYFVEKDSIIESPASSYNLIRLQQGDITGDGVREIVLHGYKSSNVDPVSTRYHDHNNWLIVLDKKLEFLFPPIKFDRGFMEVTPIILNVEGQDVLYVIASRNDRKTLVRKYNSQGSVVDSIVYDFSAHDAFITQGAKETPQISFITKEKIIVAGPDLKIVGSHPFKQPKVIYNADLTGDGTEEIIIPCFQGGQMHIYRTGYKQPVSVSIELESTNDYQFSLKESIGRSPLISLQSGQTNYLISYGKNHIYYLNWLYYVIIYLGLLSFATVIRKTQREQFQRRHITEKRINDLQLSLVHNQLNSHFSLNALNSAIHSVMFNQTAEACSNLRRFASLYKSMLLSTGKVFRRLSEEIDFCNNYLLLEKSRFDDKFDFSINVCAGVDTETPVPLMIIHTYVENAVKHGLSALKGGGFLEIAISQKDKVLLINITDNGIGRGKASQNSVESTGKGLEIMNEFYRHLRTFYKFDCKAEIEDLYDASGSTAGTRVIITIMISHAEN